LIWALVGVVIVKKRQVKTRIVQLIAAQPQQSDSVAFTLPNVLLKIEQIQSNGLMQGRPEYERIKARIRDISIRAARFHIFVKF